jgi:hypothetical protein
MKSNEPMDLKLKGEQKEADIKEILEKITKD